MRTIVILEDSSRNKIGGGQVVTLEAIRVFRTWCRVLVVDAVADSVFLQRAVRHGSAESLIVPAAKRPLSWILRCLRQTRKKLVASTANSGDVVTYAATKKTLAVAFFLRILHGIPFIYHAHMVARNGWERAILRFLLVFASRVVCVSRTVQRSLGGRRSVLVYNPMPSAVEVLPLRRDGRLRVSFVGSIIPIKGVDVLLRANRLLDPETVEIHIFGTGSQEEELKNEFRERNVRFHGYTEDAGVIFRATDMIVLPTVIREACPMVAIEAAAWGIPLITTSLGGQRELFRMLGFRVGALVAPGDPRALADAILSCGKRLKEGVRVIDSARVAALFSREKFDITMEHVIKEVHGAGMGRARNHREGKDPQ